MERPAWRTKLAKFFLIPQRYILGIMGLLGVMTAYTMRITLSVAITEMVAPSNETEHYDPDACDVEGGKNTTATVTNPSNLYDWDEYIQGIILSSFYWGYPITHIPGGVLSERFGGKHTLGVGLLITAILTLLTPPMIHVTNGSWIVLAVLRLFEGLAAGTTYPAVTALLAEWVPLDERATMGSLVYAGSQIGTIVSNALSGYLIKVTEDWASVFYFFGGLGVVWVILWDLLCYSEPVKHPFIGEEEMRYLHEQVNRLSNKEKVIPWKPMFTSMPVWALIAAQVGHDWGFYTIVTDLPKYMKDVLKFQVHSNGLWSSLPHVFMWVVSMFSGWLCDWLIKKKYMDITLARKFFTVLAAVGPGIFIMAASYSRCDRITAVAMFTLAMALMGPFYCGVKVNALDLAPNYAGTLMAIVNGIGAFAGIATPYLVGAITPNRTLMEWRTVFWISFAVFVLTSIIFIFFGSGEEQWWNESRKPDAAGRGDTEGT